MYKRRLNLQNEKKSQKLKFVEEFFYNNENLDSDEEAFEDEDWEVARFKS